MSHYFTATPVKSCDVTSHLMDAAHKGQWPTVLQMVESDQLDDTRHRGIIWTALDHWDQWEVLTILPHCSDNLVRFLLPRLVERGFWEAVSKVLQRRVSDSQQRRAIVEEASKRAKTEELVKYVLPLCSDDQLEDVLQELVTRGQWLAVGKVLQRGVQGVPLNHALVEASHRTTDAEFYKHILDRCTGNTVSTVLCNLMKKKCMIKSSKKLLYRIISDTLYTWSVRETLDDAEDSVFWNVIQDCYLENSSACRLFKAASEDTADVVLELSTRIEWSEELCELLFTSLLHTVCYLLCENIEQRKELCESTEESKALVTEIYHKINRCVTDYRGLGDLNRCGKLLQSMKTQTQVFHEMSERFTCASGSSLIISFLRGLNSYCSHREGLECDDTVFLLLTTLPVFAELQSVGLQIMLDKRRWDVISHASLSQVWEHTRRKLFKTAVEERQWSVVKRWADHTLYDDQRRWALEEAFKEKQWEVYLLLADYGLAESELMHVHYRLAKYAEWKTVLRMFERGGDVTEAKELLAGHLNDVPDLWLRHKQLSKLEHKYSAASVEDALKRCRWRVVLFKIGHGCSDDNFDLALELALKHEVWHVVVQLVRQKLEPSQLNSLFRDMVSRQQWGVCRVILEEGVSVDSCLDALPQFMKANQWILVSRVMEYEVDDIVRRQVMQWAMEKREGSLFWHCINTMHTRLTAAERETPFHQAFSRDMWQAVKPLVEEKDRTGMTHRDLALLEAVDEHLWDVVDHCQHHYADINMQDAEGNTPMHRMARKRDWEAVDALVCRDGDPSLLDSQGYSVTHRAIMSKQWDSTRLLILYQGDIHQPAQYRTHFHEERRTPLQMLIDARQGELIDLTLLWLPAQWKGVTKDGETTLHAVCLAGWCGAMYYLVARKVDPLAVTTSGHSALLYAVHNNTNPQQTVAECIQLGLSTHQPQITTPVQDTLDAVLSATGMWLGENTSPFLAAVMRDLPVVACMLYESGACSYRELFRLHTDLPKVAASRQIVYLLCEERQYQKRVLNRQLSSEILDVIHKALPYVTMVATTPRTLTSSCRIVISLCFNVRGKLHRDVGKLLLPESVTNYLLFSDFTDPQYGKDLAW